MKKKITISDIARISGYSKSTVSRSLNNNSMIAVDTRKIIQKIARDHNFVYNSSARSLTLNKINTVGIITTDHQVSTDYINLITRMVRFQLEQAGMDVIVTNAVNETTGESNILRLMQTGKVSGLVIISPEVMLDDWQYLKENPFPLVITHFRPPNATVDCFSTFYVDNEVGGFMATEHLIKQGLRNILTITEGGGQLQFYDRTAGYYRALDQFGIQRNKDFFIEGECSYDFAYQAVMDRKGLLPRIDGIFVQADIMAAGTINALRDLQICIPRDISVIGFDDLHYSRYLRPSLTTVHQPKEEMVMNACDCLKKQINGESYKVEQRVFQPQLIFRESCSPEKIEETPAHNLSS